MGGHHGHVVMYIWPSSNKKKGPSWSKCAEEGSPKMNKIKAHMRLAKPCAGPVFQSFSGSRRIIPVFFLDVIVRVMEANLVMFEIG